MVIVQEKNENPFPISICVVGDGFHLRGGPQKIPILCDEQKNCSTAILSVHAKASEYFRIFLDELKITSKYWEPQQQRPYARTL